MISRRWFFWFSLIIVLTGTPARQVEAANDCARTMAEQDDDDRRVEEIDGGVGDDALEAIESGTSALEAVSDPFAWPDLLAATFYLIPAESPAGPETTTLPVPGWSPALSARREAWLQRFLW